MKRSLDEIEWDISKGEAHTTALLEEQEILEKERIAFLRGTRFSCPDCGRRSTLSKWVFVQIKRYERPRGCSEGDTWHDNSPDKCGIRHKCGGIFYIPRLAHQGKLLRIFERVGQTQVPKLFGGVENLAEKDLLTLCRR